MNWIKFLFVSQIDFYIRLRCNTLVSKEGQTRHATDWLGERKKCLLDGVSIHGHWVSLAIKRLTNQQDEYLIVMTNTFAHRALNLYQRRWSIETEPRWLSFKASNSEAFVWKIHTWMIWNAYASFLLWWLSLSPFAYTSGDGAIARRTVNTKNPLK